MVSLSRPVSNAPLTARLAASPRPAIIHRPTAAGSPGGPGDAGVDARIEISGSVLMTWIAKTVALAEAEGLDGGTRVRLNLPLHWLSLAVATGLACAGAELVDDPAATDVEAVLTQSAAEAQGTPALVLTLPRDLSPIRGAAEHVDAPDVDVAAELLGGPDRYTGPTDAMEAADLGEAAPSCAAAPEGPLFAVTALTRAHVAAAVTAWADGSAVVLTGEH